MREDEHDSLMAYLRRVSRGDAVDRTELLAVRIHGEPLTADECDRVIRTLNNRGLVRLTLGHLARPGLKDLVRPHYHLTDKGATFLQTQGGQIFDDALVDEETLYFLSKHKQDGRWVNSRAILAHVQTMEDHRLLDLSYLRTRCDFLSQRSMIELSAVPGSRNEFVCRLRAAGEQYLAAKASRLSTQMSSRGSMVNALEAFDVMDYSGALQRLKQLLKRVDEYLKADDSGNENTKQIHDEIVQLYGGVREVYLQQTGRSVIHAGSGSRTSIYPNFFEAGYFSGFTHQRHQGRNELLMVLGKVEQLAKDPVVPKNEYSVTEVVRILDRFRPCCQYVRQGLRSEQEVQDIVWLMLRSHFDRVEREETLPKFGQKSFHPDFGIRVLRLLIEVKYIGEKTNVGEIQEAIQADVPGFLKSQNEYDSLIVFVYDGAHKLRDSKSFEESLRKIGGILAVMVVPGIGSPA